MFFVFKIEVATIKRMPRTMITLGVKKLLKEVAQYIPSKTKKKKNAIYLKKKIQQNNKVLELQAFIREKGLVCAYVLRF